MLIGDAIASEFTDENSLQKALFSNPQTGSSLFQKVVTIILSTDYAHLLPLKIPQ